MKGAKRMENGAFAAYLQHFGLSRQEALVYQNLLLYGKRTGYEIAKETGISRSNVYGALSVLAEKGAAYVLEESAKKYIPVKLEEFCGNWIRKLKEEEQWMRENLPDIKEVEEGYITIEGDANIRDKLHNLIRNAAERVYISGTGAHIHEFAEDLELLVEKKRKVVIITDEDGAFPGTSVYLTGDKGNQIGVIVDSKYALSGEYGGGNTNTCLYSGQKNFVELFKNALANEIRLIRIGQESLERQKREKREGEQGDE